MWGTQQGINCAVCRGRSRCHWSKQRSVEGGTVSLVMHPYNTVSIKTCWLLKEKTKKGEDTQMKGENGGAVLLISEPRASQPGKKWAIILGYLERAQRSSSTRAQCNKTLSDEVSDRGRQERERRTREVIMDCSQASEMKDRAKTQVGLRVGSMWRVSVAADTKWQTHHMWGTHMAPNSACQPQIKLLYVHAEVQHNVTKQVDEYRALTQQNQSDHSMS